MDYPLMNPPFQMKDFEEMSKKEAQQHFEWFIKQIPKKLELLKQLINEYEFETSLDFSKEFLEKLWRLYLNNVEIVEKTKEELEKEHLMVSEMTKMFIKKKKIPLSWMVVAMDIAIYFAECLIRNNKELKWDVVTKPKSLSHVNKPVVTGFNNNMLLNPLNIIFIQTRKIIKGEKDDKALVQLYENWEEHI